jgi:hypothetical protein
VTPLFKAQTAKRKAKPADVLFIRPSARDGGAVGQLDPVYTAFLRKAALKSARAHQNDG